MNYLVTHEWSKTIKKVSLVLLCLISFKFFLKQYIRIIDFLDFEESLEWILDII